MILCCGEALIDFLPVKTADNADAFQPFNGGSVYNVAITLGRLGTSVGFFGGLSEDFFGDMLVDGLLSSNVDMSLAIRNSRPSTLAFVNFSNGEPEYAFLDEGSVSRMLETGQMPEIPAPVKAMHFGSISLIHDPAASALEALASRESADRIISIDPNIRPTLISDRKTHTDRLERLFALADIMKISTEDLAWLRPDSPHEDFATGLLSLGVTLVVITDGSKGATGYTRDARIAQPPMKVDVIDTVGAGDTFMAGLLASFDRNGLLQPDRLRHISESDLTDALSLASRAAAIAVSRAGANPPWASELSG